MMYSDDYSHIVYSLIRDDLIYVRFLDELPEETDTSTAYLHLHQAIFELMGLSNYPDLEELTDWYFQKTEQAISMDYHKLDELVLDIYAGLKVKYHGKN